MTKHENPAALEASAQNIFVPVTREQLLESAINFFSEHPSQKFRLFHGLEFMTNEHLHELETAGTVLQPLEEALAASNLPIDGTVKALMQPPLLLTSRDLHAVACDCDAGVSHVGGEVAALIFHGAFGYFD
jgi:hypothetical protein